MKRTLNAALASAVALAYCIVADAVADCALCREAELRLPAEWRQSRTLHGLWGNGCDRQAEGVVQLRCGKANKRGVAKVSLAITPFVGRKMAYKAASVDVSAGGAVEVRWGDSCHVEISGDSFRGETQSSAGCAPGAFWSASVGGSVDGLHVLSMPLWRDVDGDDPTKTAEGSESQLLDVLGLWERYYGGYCSNGNVDYSSMEFSADGRKWAFSASGFDGKPPKIGYDAETGLFKGTIYVKIGPYCMPRPAGRSARPRAYPLKVVGVCANGVMYGMASYKTFSTPVAGL